MQARVSRVATAQLPSQGASTMMKTHTGLETRTDGACKVPDPSPGGVAHRSVNCADNFAHVAKPHVSTLMSTLIPCSGLLTASLGDATRRAGAQR
jgi:hypothetical protein